MKATMKDIHQQITEIAKEALGIETLETRGADSLDFHDVAVWGVQSALEAAFNLGMQHQKTVQQAEHLHSPASLRQRNATRAVLRQLYQGISVEDLCAATGWPRQTVETVVTEWFGSRPQITVLFESEQRASFGVRQSNKNLLRVR